MTCLLVWRFLLVVSILAGLTNANCIDTIHEILSSPGGSQLMGGYRRMENPENDAVVTKIMTDSVQRFNRMYNGVNLYHVSGVLEAYSQLVNGFNYCIRFMMNSNECRTAINYDCTDEKTCVVSAYKAFNQESANIDGESLVCA